MYEGNFKAKITMPAKLFVGQIPARYLEAETSIFLSI